jgi:surface protein
MERNATATIVGRTHAAALLFAALLLASFGFAVPAFADDSCDGAIQESQVAASSESQCYEAVLYSDGELVIRKADSAEPASQGALEDAASGEGQGEKQEVSNQVGDTESGAENADPADNDQPKGGAVEGQASEPAVQPVALPAETPAPASANEAAVGNERLCCGPYLWPMWWPDPSTPTGRYVVATYDDVGAEADRADSVKWYGNRDKIKSVVFGEGVAPESMAYWFAGLQNLSEVNFAGLDTSRATNMQSLFDGCRSLKALDTKAFDTSCVTNMSRLFADCSSLVDIDLSSFDTSRVTSMDGMFAGCSSVRALNLSGFDTGNVKSTEGMLEGCSSLAALDASSFSTAQLSAMAVPANKGGYWRFNVPSDYPVDVDLRAPTAEERAAFGLPLGFGGGGNTSPEPAVDDDEKLPTVDEGAQKPDSSVGDQGGAKQPDSNAGPNEGSRAGTSDSSREAAGADAREATGIFGAAPAEAKRDEAADDASLPQLVSIISGITQLGESPAIARSVADALLSDAMHRAADVAMALAIVDPGLSAVVDSLASPWPATPMAPFGIPLNILATALLLLIALPVTVLILRDRRL